MIEEIYKKDGRDIDTELRAINIGLKWIKNDISDTSKYKEIFIFSISNEDVSYDDILTMMDRGYRFVEFGLSGLSQGVVMEVD